MQKKKSTIAKRYKVRNAQAVKMKIIWLHLQALVAQVYEVDKPDSPGKKLLQQYQADWRAAELSERTLPLLYLFVVAM